MNKNFKKTSLSVALCSIGLATSTPGFTQQEDGDSDASSAVIEELVVTGIRSAQREGISSKRNSAQFVDSILASDAGKLPDVNVAETLGRISGVQIDRGIGEGSDISIRGQRQNVILFNGRQIFDSSGRGGTGPDQLNTSTYGLLTLVPSGVIGKLDVTKLPGSDDVAGSLGGIVDINTRKPLDKEGFSGVASIGLGSGDLSDGTDTDIFAVLSNTFADNTLGLQVSFSQRDRNVAERGLGTFSGYGNYSNTGVTFLDPGENGDPNGDGNFGFFHLDPRLQTIDEERENTAITAMLQWQASENVELILDVFNSETESDRDRYWQGFFAGFGTHANTVFSSNEILLSADVGRPIQTNVEFADITSDINSTGLSLDWDLTDNISLDSHVAVTKSESTYDQLFFRLQSAERASISYDLTDGDFGRFTSNIDLTDPTALNLAILFDNDFLDETDTEEFQTDLDWNLAGGFFNSFEFGFRYQNIDTIRSVFNRDVRPNLNVATTPSVSAVTELVTTDFFTGLSANENAVTGCGVFLSDLSASDQALCNATVNAGSQLNSFQIEESFTSAYAKANFATELSGGRSLSGNVGVRFIDRDLVSIGSIVSGGNISPNVFERSDSEVLPSAVMKVDLNENLLLRLGAAKVIAFPNTSDLNNGLRLNGDFTGVGGSPALDPFEATQLDASLEYYFADDAIASIGIFSKDIDTFIVSRTDIESVQGVNFSIARNVNGNGADVSGLELLYQQPFASGFGIQATYSYIDSETPIQDDNGRELPLNGLSENSVNLVLYYENDTFSTRLAYNWRDEYLQGLGPNNTGVFIDGYEDLSATVRWDINDYYSLSFEATNLLDSQLSTFNAVPEALRTNLEYGTGYKITLTGSF